MLPHTGETYNSIVHVFTLCHLFNIEIIEKKFTSCMLFPTLSTVKVKITLNEKFLIETGH